MVGRCKNCNHYECFDKNDEFGIRLKLSNQKCECGGSFEQMIFVRFNTYRNRKGKKFELTDVGEFKNYTTKK